MAKYSIIVPAYNEEKSLQLFYDAVTPLMRNLQEEYEIIFINDGSRDATKEILRGLADLDKRVKVCNFPAISDSRRRFIAAWKWQAATR